MAVKMFDFAAAAARPLAAARAQHLRNAARALELDDLGLLRSRGLYAKRQQDIDFMVGATGIEPVTPIGPSRGVKNIHRGAKISLRTAARFMPARPSNVHTSY
jgi:hypothetical protein